MENENKNNRKMNNGLKFSLLVLLTTILTLVLVGGFNVLIDPFYHYHGPLDGKQPYMNNAYYQTTGAARHFTYDCAIVGTSLSENSHISWFSDYGYTCEKFTYPSASLKDYGMILNAIFESNNQVKMIVMDVSDIQLTAEKGTVYTTEADYINDNNILSDYNYIWNMDVTRQSVFRSLDMISGKTNEHDYDYTWENPEFFNSDNCKRDAVDARAMIKNAIELGTYEYFDNNYVCDARENLKEITDVIEAHPETQFNIYIPPFSILYWELENLEGRTRWMLEVYGDTVSILNSYDNVNVYSFIDEKDIIENLELYRDTGHYSPEINRYIVNTILNDDHKTDFEDFQIRSNEFCEFLDNYDFDSLWIDK